jgi:hypothetical protein
LPNSGLITTSDGSSGAGSALEKYVDFFRRRLANGGLLPAGSSDLRSALATSAPLMTSLPGAGLPCAGKAALSGGGDTGLLAGLPAVFSSKDRFLAHSKLTSREPKSNLGGQALQGHHLGKIAVEGCVRHKVRTQAGQADGVHNNTTTDPSSRGCGASSSEDESLAPLSSRVSTSHTGGSDTERTRLAISRPHVNGASVASLACRGRTKPPTSARIQTDKHVWGHLP